MLNFVIPSVLILFMMSFVMSNAYTINVVILGVVMQNVVILGVVVQNVVTLGVVMQNVVILGVVVQNVVTLGVVMQNVVILGVAAPSRKLISLKFHFFERKSEICSYFLSLLNLFLAPSLPVENHPSNRHFTY
jgi:hypothetical protein